jgi:D-beta-D-heptose 7-phosphate kinase/D-beta-D-heptose 1-phosphate adenosyltransferase
VYPTDKTEVFDVCGAGDVFLSTLVYAFLQTRSIEKSIPMANKAASYSVSKMGTYVMTTGDLKQLGIL